MTGNFLGKSNLTPQHGKHRRRPSRGSWLEVSWLFDGGLLNSSGPDFFTKVSSLCGNNHYISLYNPILSNFWNNHECSSIQARNIWGSIDFDQSQQWLFTKQASFEERLILHPYEMAIQIDSCRYPIPISLGYHRLSRHICSLNPFLVAEILEPFAPRQQVFSFLAGAPVFR